MANSLSIQPRLLQAHQSARGAPPTAPSADRVSAGEIEFYTKLALYSTVSPFNGKHSERNKSMEAEGSGTTELRRDFLDKFSYLCDINTSGATVTAAALQQQSRQFHILWLAANEDVKPEVKVFVAITLEKLREVTPENKKNTELAILQDAVGKGQQRFEFYRARLLEFAKVCKDQLNESQDEPGERLCSWIRRLIRSSYGVDWCGLADLCYEARGQELSSLHNRAEATPQDDDGTNCYAELAHYVGRLGAYVHAVRVIVKAALRIPSVKYIRQVRYEEASSIKRIILPQSSLDAYQIMKAICSNLNPAEMEQYMLGFFRQDFNQNFNEKLLEHPSLQAGNTIVTRVHAEILLADLFSRRDFNFVGDDKYIGCSKGACFCCASYLSLHHFDFIEPASHNKVILGWRGPEANPSLDRRGLGKHKLALMEKKMNWMIEDRLLQSLRDPESRRFNQHLSTNGTSRASSVVGSKPWMRR